MYNLTGDTTLADFEMDEREMELFQAWSRLPHDVKASLLRQRPKLWITVAYMVSDRAASNEYRQPINHCNLNT